MYPDARRTLHVCPEALHKVGSRALSGTPLFLAISLLEGAFIRQTPLPLEFNKQPDQCVMEATEEFYVWQLHPEPIL